MRPRVRRRPTSTRLYARRSRPVGLRDEPVRAREVRRDDRRARRPPVSPRARARLLDRRPHRRGSPHAATSCSPSTSPRRRSRARARPAALPHVRVRAARDPRGVPAGPFDLIVASEVLYYLDAPALEATLDAIAARSTRRQPARRPLAPADAHVSAGRRRGARTRSPRLGWPAGATARTPHYALDRFDRRMSDARRLVIVGGGPAGLAAARAYREAGGDGDVTMLDAGARPALHAARRCRRSSCAARRTRPSCRSRRAAWYESTASTCGSAPTRDGPRPRRAHVVTAGGETLPLRRLRARHRRGADARCPCRARRRGRARCCARSTTRARLRGARRRRRSADRDRLRLHRLRGRRLAGACAACTVTLSARTSRSRSRRGSARRPGGGSPAGWRSTASTLRLGARRGGREAIARRTALDAELVLMAAGDPPAADLAGAPALRHRGRRGSSSTSACARAPTASTPPATSRSPTTPPPAGRCAVEHWGEALNHGRGRRADDRRRRTRTGTPRPASGRRSASARSSTSPGATASTRRALVEPRRRRVHGLVRRATGITVGVLTHERDEDYERGRELVESGSAAAVTLPARPDCGLRRRARARRGGARSAAASRALAAQQGVAGRVRGAARARPLHATPPSRGAARPPPRDLTPARHPRRRRRASATRAGTGMDLACARLLAPGGRRADRHHRRRLARRARTGCARSSTPSRAGALAIGGRDRARRRRARRLPAARARAARRRGRRTRLARRARRRAGAREHHQFSGASIGVTAATYAAVGGARAARARSRTRASSGALRAPRRSRSTGSPPSGSPPPAGATAARRAASPSTCGARGGWPSAATTARDFTLERAARAQDATTVSVVLPGARGRGHDRRRARRDRAARARRARRRAARRRRRLARRHARGRRRARRARASESDAAARARPRARQGRRDVARARRHHAATLVAFLDTDTEDFDAGFVLGLLGPLLTRPGDRVRQGRLPPPAARRRHRARPTAAAA